MDLKTVIREEYVSFNVPADQIVTDISLAKQFMARVQARYPDALLELSTFNRLLINLRKKGENRGGLPKIRQGKLTNTK